MGLDCVDFVVLIVLIAVCVLLVLGCVVCC